MEQYKASGLEDLKLYRWWEKMVLSGDLQRGYTGMDKLSAFFNAMQVPTQLLYEENETGIWFTSWIEPQTFGGALVHVWIASEARQTKRATKAVMLALTHFLSLYPVLIGVTNSEAIALEHEKVGFVRLGEIPFILGDESTYVTFLTRAAFERAAKHFAPLMDESELQ
jgi:hypothetical protein